LVYIYIQFKNKIVSSASLFTEPLFGDWFINGFNFSSSPLFMRECQHITSKT